MSASRLVIDSRLRDSGTVEDYTYELQSPIRNVTGVTLLSAVLAKSSYDVITGFNDTIDFNYNGAGPHTAVLTSQNYTGTQLATAVAAALNTGASTADFACTFDSQTGRLTVTTTTNNFTMGPQTTTPQAQLLLGFTNTGASAMTFTGTNMINTSYPLYLLCDIDFGTSQGFGESTWCKENSYTMVVPFGSADRDEFEYFTPDQGFRQSQGVSDQNMQKIRIRLRAPDTANGTQAPPANFSLNNVDHLLVFQIFQAF